MRLEYLPLIYILVIGCYTLLRKKCSYKYSVPSVFFEIASFVKYFLIPVLICTDVKYKDVIGPPVSSASFSIAISVTIYEMICLYFFRYLYIARVKKESNNAEVMMLSNHINLLARLALLSGLFFVLFFGDIFFPDFYLLSEKDADNNKMIPTFSILISIWKYFSYVIFMCVVYLNYRKSRWSKKKSICVASCMHLVYIYLLLGTSRWTLIFFSSVTFVLLMKLYGKSIRRIFYLFLPVILVLFFLISFYKFQNELSFSNGFINTFASLFAMQLQSYFSGITVLAQAIDMSNDEIFSSFLRTRTLLNDLLGVPILSNFISDPLDRPNILFNQYVLSVDTLFFTQIMPSSGIGYIYFGFLFSPIFVVLFNICGLYFENKQRKEVDIYMKYVYLYISLWASLSLCFNIQIVLGNIGFRMLPLWVLYWVINRFSFRRSRSKLII